MPMVSTEAKSETLSDSGDLFRILALDGGGAKGFYTLGVLEEIEAMTGRTVCETFELIFGTSTGAIIAALLARGEKVSAVRKLYEQYVPVIMRARTTNSRTAALHRLAKEVFGDQRHDVFKTNIGIVATNWNEEKPFIFKASVRQAHGSKASFKPFFGVDVADAVISSCSAYPFFSRHKVTKENGDIVELADGGFCANNPTLYAIADATQALQRKPENLRVVSLGVGSYPQPSVFKRAGRLVTNLSLLRHIPSSDFMQKVLGTNTCSMDVLRGILFRSVQTIRISDSFVEPQMATDLLEHDMAKLNRLVQKGRSSFAQHEAKLSQFLTL